MRIQSLIILLIVILFPAIINAQNVKVINDLRSRSSIAVSKGLYKDFEIFSELEIGLEENLSKLGKLHAEIGLNYSPYKFLKLEAKYRYTKNRKDYSEEYKYTNLISLSAEAKKKIDRFTLYYRFQYQNNDDESLWDGYDNEIDVYKNRLKLKYNIWGTKLEPYLSSEIYIQNGIDGIDATKLKTICGIEYPLAKYITSKAFYRNDRELTNFIPYTYHTFGFQLNFQFK